MKRILLKVGFIALLSLIGSLSSWAHEFEWEGLWYYTLDDEPGACLVSKPRTQNYKGDIVVPSTAYDGETPYNVVGIRAEAFAYASWADITSIVIPDNVRTIGREAFSGANLLHSVVIGSGIETIMDGAFKNCKILEELTINAKKAPECGENVFANTSCEKIFLKIPEGATGYDVEPWSLFSPEESVFIADGIRYCIIDRDALICEVIPFADKKYTGDIVIPASVKNENNGKTYKVEAIGYSAFYCCSGVTSVTLPQSLQTIGDYAFGVTGITEIDIPESVTAIEFMAFYGCPLTEVVIPDGVTEIKDWTFGGCSSLTSVTIPKSVTEIGRGAFYECRSLSEIVIPDGVTEIKSGTFKNCSSLKSVTIPASVTKIEGTAFEQNSDWIDYSETVLSMKGEVPPTCDNSAFSGPWFKATLVVPKGCVEAYKSAEVWKQFANIVEGTSGIEGVEVDGNAGDGTVYDLTGRRVKNPTSGFYIVNGRKVLIRR